MLRLLHVSDIHFSNIWEGQPELDVELSVRERMLVDISKMRESLGPMDAVLVVGDIASRGKPEEYEAATRFLDGATELVGCQSDQVICVPGNHDVDRGRHDLAHEALRQQLRGLSTIEVSDKLLRLLREDTTSRTLFNPFDAYSVFAIAYQCDISPERPVWAPKRLALDSRVLQVHGVTSAWVSDESDSPDFDAQRLVAGIFQVASVGSDPDAITMVLCHHPLRWLRDSAELRPWMAMAQIVLSGHEHAAGIHISHDGKSVHVASGAVNPYRTEGAWIPAYNVLELTIPREQPNALEVRVYARSWQGERAEFGPDQDYPSAVVHRIPIGGERLESIEPAGVPEVGVIPSPLSIGTSQHAQIHTVMRAAPDRRRTLAREMGLLTDESLLGIEADRALLRSAIETRRLPELAARLVGGFADDA